MEVTTHMQLSTRQRQRKQRKTQTQREHSNAAAAAATASKTRRQRQTDIKQTSVTSNIAQRQVTTTPEKRKLKNCQRELKTQMLLLQVERPGR